MFRDAIKNELARIQRLIDLTPPHGNNEIGSLHLKGSGQSVYCYEEWYGNDKHPRKKYLGKLHSEPVTRHVGVRIQRERHKRLLQDEKILQEVMDAYLDYDYASVVSSLPSSYQRAADGDFYDERYEELKAGLSEYTIRNPS